MKQGILNQLLKDRSLQPKFARIRRLCYNKFSFDEFKEAVKEIFMNSFKGYKIDGKNMAVFDQIVKWIQGDPTFECNDPRNQKKWIKGNVNKGLCIWGNTGSGKTLMTELLSYFCNVCDIRCLLDSEVSMKFRSIRASEIVTQFRDTGSIKELVKTKFLIIQDVGSEQTECNYMGNHINCVREIIEERGDRYDCITIITTNHDIDKLTQLYGERASSRMMAMFNFIYLGGCDRRIE